MFEPFEQVIDGSMKPHEGNGLGSAISSQLVHLMGGQMAVESEVGRGSRWFHFTARFQTIAGQEETHGPAEPPGRARGLRVPVGEDNATCWRDPHRDADELADAADRRRFDAEGDGGSLVAGGRGRGAVRRGAGRRGDAAGRVLLATDLRREPGLAGAVVLMLTPADAAHADLCRDPRVPSVLKPIKQSEPCWTPCSRWAGRGGEAEGPPPLADPDDLPAAPPYARAPGRGRRGQPAAGERLLEKAGHSGRGQQRGRL
ncbi:MAG: ATP-binding protein [Gemmataceae bacterium]